MKVLYVCNSLLPEISKHLNARNVKPESWIESQIKILKKVEGIEIVYAFPFKNCVNGTLDGINYYSFLNDNISKMELCLENIFRKEQPDIIHVFGTEYSHSLATMNVSKRLGIIDKTVVSIQGLIYFISKYHYFSDLPLSIILGYTLRDILRFDNIYRQRIKMFKRGKNEIETLKRATNVIGRTNWDFACCNIINPSINYHHCNEILRDSFYSNQWSINNCKKHTIFCSQSSYPHKGFHLLIEAFLIVLKYYPDATIITTGNDLCHKLTIKERLLMPSYPRYNRKLIKKNGLSNKISFLGFLNESQMANAFLSSHVFVSPSSIENSPNSVGEAMILGVPTIASNVGGVSDFIINNEEGILYPFNEPYILAWSIMKVFNDSDFANKLSKNGRERALLTHNRNKNTNELLKIYSSIIKRNVKIN